MAGFVKKSSAGSVKTLVIAWYNIFYNSGDYGDRGY